jgi:hypothetical protein
VSLYTRIVILVESDREFGRDSDDHEVIANRLAGTARRYVEDLIGDWPQVKGVTTTVGVRDRRP